MFWRRLFIHHLTNPDLLWQGGLIYNETTRFRLNDIMLRIAGRDSLQLKRLFEDLSVLVPCKSNKYSNDSMLTFSGPVLCLCKAHKS